MLRFSVLGRLLVAIYVFMSSYSVTAQVEDEGSGIQFAPEDDSSAPDEQSDMFYKDEEETPAATPQVPKPAAVETKPAAPTPPPAPGNQIPATNSEESKQTLDLSGGRRNVLFGSYRVRIGLAQPDFEKLNYYDKLYGDEALYPTIAADWFFWDWYATMGISFRTGFYTAQGKAAKEIEKPLQDITADDVQKDPNSKTNLTVIPLQVALTAEITPLRQKWLVVDGYIGFESLYFQEVRNSPDAKTAALIQTAEATEEAETDDSLTNKGTKQLTVLGFSANILLNGIDNASANSMRGTMGLANIYLSPFIEYSRALDKSPLSNNAVKKNPDFSRTTMGIGFTFESIK